MQGETVVATAREIKAKVRKELEARITARTDAAVDVAKAASKVAELETALEDARGEYGDKVAVALALMSATDLAGLVDATAGELRAAAKRRSQGAGAGQAGLDLTGAVSGDADGK